MDILTDQNINAFLKKSVIAITIICVSPLLLNMLGFDFASPSHEFNIHTMIAMPQAAIQDAMFYALAGGIQHVLLEWSSVVIAMITALMAFIHYRNNNDITVPIMGMALLCSGFMDAFHTLAATRLISSVAENSKLIPFTWALSRTFHAAILILGILVVLSVIKKGGDKKFETGVKEVYFVIFVSIFFVIFAYITVYLSATSQALPQTQFPDAFITRPYDVAPMLLFCIATPLFMLLYKKNPSLFTAGLLVVVIPEIILEAHMAFGSSQLFDNHFNISHFLKIIAYLVPLTALLLDYLRTYSRHTSSQKELFHALKEAKISAEKMEAILASAADAIITMNYKGIVSSFNGAACKIFGYDESEVVGQNIKMLMPPQLAVVHDGHLDRYKRTRVKSNIGSIREDLALRKNGEVFPMELSVSEVVTEDGSIYTGFVRDVSERAEAKVKQESLIEELVDSNEDLERFAYVCSHDLQEPLRMVRSFTQRLEKYYEGKELDEKPKKYMNYITDGAERAQDLIADILAYSRLEYDSKMEEIQLNDIMSSIKLNLSQIMEERNATITNSILPSIYGNKTLILQLLQNLIINAIKYSDKDPVVHIGVEGAEGNWQFSVSDNGVGIPKEYQEKIFVIFQRLQDRSDKSGTGIGLAICKKIVSKHGGEIWVDSEPGKGSTFYFTIKMELEEK